MRKWVFGLVVAGVLGAGGCEPELQGTCDDAARALAMRVACTPEQVPQYAGQALINGSCAGAFCHSSAAKNGSDPENPDSRRGVPAGFDFDLEHARTPAERERLRAHREEIVDERGQIYGVVVEGEMPPRDLPGFDRVRELQGTFADDGSELPTLDTAEGRAILRAWLLCGAPVAERTTADPALPGAPAGDALDATACGVSANTFDALYDGVIRGSCAVDGCHGGTPPTGMMAFPPDDLDAAYASLVGTGAMGAACTDAPRTRVVAGDPDASLLIQKLEGDGTPDGAACGSRMPLGGPYLAPSVIEAFRAWIADGAQR